MDATATRVAHYIVTEQLLDADCPIVVGLSGGADSVALVAILTELGYKVAACHCNFKLRGDESVRDRDHAAGIARTLNVPFYETEFETGTYAGEKNISIEMAARELRYEWFETMRRKLNAQAIAVAHHRDDKVETMLLNLVRGTGIAGLTAMKPRNGYVVRPLLCITRNQILTYLQHRALTYVDDSTNALTVYTRNKIRHEVLPMLRTINPAVDESLEHTIAHLTECEKLYRSAVEQERAAMCSSNDEIMSIDVARLLLCASPRAMLYEIMSQYGFNSAQIADMLACCTAQRVGKVFHSATHRVVCDRQQLIVTPRPADDANEILALWDEGDTHSAAGITISYHDAQGFVIPRDVHCACFDAHRLHFPLVLRRWRKGDSFVPFGMKGRKKLSDYFSDNKFSLVEKERVAVLCDDNDILWIAGHRAANTARVTTATKRIVMAVISDPNHINNVK